MPDVTIKDLPAVVDLDTLDLTKAAFEIDTDTTGESGESKRIQLEDLIAEAVGRIVPANRVGALFTIPSFFAAGDAVVDSTFTWQFIDTNFFTAGTSSIVIVEPGVYFLRPTGSGTAELSGAGTLQVRRNGTPVTKLDTFAAQTATFAVSAGDSISLFWEEQSGETSAVTLTNWQLSLTPLLLT